MNKLTINPKIIKSILILLLTIPLFVGCSKDENTPDPEPTPSHYETYISHEYIKPYSLSAITTLFSNIGILYPEAAELASMAQYNVEIYKIEYGTNLQGERITASGLLCVPVSSGNSFPIVSFQNGTNTAHANAPSKDLYSPIFQYLHASASLGYIMLIPDYLGFGSSEQVMHPYLHKESTVGTVENMIAATIEMIDNDLINIKWDNDLYLIGYSQGGWATLATHNDISQSTDLSFNVTASACGAGPYDLSVVQNFMFENTTYPQPLYIAYTSISYHSLGIVNNSLTDFFNEPYATDVPGYFNGQYTNSEINAMLTDTVANLMTPNFLTGFDNAPEFDDYRMAINNNSIHGWNTSTPIRLYHGTADNYVPPATSEKVYDEFVAAGASNNVTYIPLPGQNHVGGYIPMGIDAMIWFSEMENKSVKVSLSK